MPVKSLEKPEYVYVAYCRNEFLDFIEFRRTIEAIVQKVDEQRDIIIDLTRAGNISEWELSVLANIVKRFQGTKRYLKIIVDESKKTKIESTNMLKAGNISIHTSFISLSEKP
jgi:hypothetical protein